MPQVPHGVSLFHLQCYSPNDFEKRVSAFHKDGTALTGITQVSLSLNLPLFQDVFALTTFCLCSDLISQDLCASVAIRSALMMSMNTGYTCSDWTLQVRRDMQFADVSEGDFVVLFHIPFTPSWIRS